MRKVVTIIAAVLALAMLTATVAMAGGKSNKTGDTVAIVQIFDDDGNIQGPPFVTIGDITGTVKLTRRTDGLTATAKVEGLTPGGVYTFWLVVGVDSYELPNAFVANGGARVIGNSGKATVRINAEVGETGIEGYLSALLGAAQDPDTLPFHDTLDLNPMEDEVHVEIAYHGPKSAAGGNIGKWRSDFWTGEACPTGTSGYNPGGTTGAFLDVNLNGQGHCPVSYVAFFPAP